MKIEVRVWDTYENRMVYDAQNTYDYGCEGVPIWEDSFRYVNENDSYIKMLYTGERDKNDRKIYEGDIVKGVEVTGTIKYKNAMFIIACPSLCRGDIPLYDLGQFYEVIGNIHENPELLSKED